MVPRNREPRLHGTIDALVRDSGGRGGLSPSHGGSSSVPFAGKKSEPAFEVRPSAKS
jgi:hypothetical protein